MTPSEARKILGVDTYSRIANMGRRQFRDGKPCPYYEDTVYAFAWRMGAATL